MLVSLLKYDNDGQYTVGTLAFITTPEIVDTSAKLEGLQSTY